MDLKMTISLDGIIVGIASIIIGIVGLIISILNFRRNRLEVLNQYFSYAREKDIVYGKRLIYNSNFQQIEDMKKTSPKECRTQLLK